MRVLPASAQTAAVAADFIGAGKLVVVPTETVYGLAADALNPAAVGRIFEAKGRPSENPLIVHVSSMADVANLADAIPPAVHLLAREFWPGPITFVLPKKGLVPDITTGGLATVAVRMPGTSVTRELARLAGPLAAPSANRFMSVSPTKVEHLDPELLKRVELVIDGGPCEVGLESTVLDLCGEPRILRPGGISATEIEAVLGRPVLTGGDDERRSPGQYPRHYAPQTLLRLVASVAKDAAGLTFAQPANDRQIQMPTESKAYAAALYDALHRLDSFGADEAEVAMPPETAEWTAVRDRLRRASS